MKKMKNKIDLRELIEVDNPGESDLKKYLRENGFKVEDVSGNCNYWHKDIDLIATDNYGVTKTIEVKWDNRIHDTGNLYIEYYNDCSKGTKGWILFTQADILAYGDSYNRIFYLFSMKDIKDYIEQNRMTLRTRTTNSDNRGGISKGYLVKLEDLQPLIKDTLYV